MDQNLADGKVRLVVAADAIPRELARIVEFLNDQMRADVRAVELGWFESDEGEEDVGSEDHWRLGACSRGKEPAQTAHQSPQWIVENYADDAETASGIRHHLDIAEELGLESSASPHHDVFASGRDGRWPFSVYRGNGGIAVNLTGAEALRADLVRAVGKPDADNKERPRFGARRLNDPDVRRRYREFMSKFVEEAGLGKKT